MFTFRIFEGLDVGAWSHEVHGVLCLRLIRLQAWLASHVWSDVFMLVLCDGGAVLLALIDVAGAEGTCTTLVLDWG